MDQVRSLQLDQPMPLYVFGIFLVATVRTVSGLIKILFAFFNLFQTRINIIYLLHQMTVPSKYSIFLIPNVLQIFHIISVPRQALHLQKIIQLWCLSLVIRSILFFFFKLKQVMNFYWLSNLTFIKSQALFEELEDVLLLPCETGRKRKSTDVSPHILITAGERGTVIFFRIDYQVLISANQ